MSPCQNYFHCFPVFYKYIFCFHTLAGRSASSTSAVLLVNLKETMVIKPIMLF